MPDLTRCAECNRPILVRADGTLRKHGPPANRCPGGGERPAAPDIPWGEAAPPPLPITPRTEETRDVA